MNFYFNFLILMYRLELVGLKVVFDGSMNRLLIDMEICGNLFKGLLRR